MTRPSDSRFALSKGFGEIHSPSSSKLTPEQIMGDSESYSHADADPTSEHEESVDGLGDGMDVDGFSGPKVVKPLTQEALAAFRAAQEKAGVIYISRIPPGMQPAKVRHLMGQYGEVGRVYLQKEGMMLWIIVHS
jgi:ESF2/ABP1 family protein